MKFVKLQVLCKPIENDSENFQEQSYKSVLEDLKISTDTDEDVFWKDSYFNIQVLKDEVLTIESRTGNENSQSVFYFFDGRSVIVNKPLEELIVLLNDTK